MEYFIKRFILIQCYLICSARKVCVQLAPLTLSSIFSTNSFHSRKIKLLTVWDTSWLSFPPFYLTLFLSFVWKASCFTRNSCPSQNKSSRSSCRLNLPQEAYLVLGIINILFQLSCNIHVCSQAEHIIALWMEMMYSPRTRIEHFISLLAFTLPIRAPRTQWGAVKSAEWYFPDVFELSSVLPLFLLYEDLFRALLEQQAINTCV